MAGLLPRGASQRMNVCARYWLALLVGILIALVLPGCGQRQEADRLLHTRDPSAVDVVGIATGTQVVDEVVTASPTRLPSSPTPVPEPSLTPARTATTTGQAPTSTPETCLHEYFFEPPPGACPAGESLPSMAAEQPFERGFMIWLEETDSIYVFGWDGSWSVYEDTFEEGQVENDPSIVPPAGLFQPIRGFGKVWRGNPKVQLDLGWATSRELAYESILQEQEVDAEDFAVTFIKAFNGQILALTRRSGEAGEWVIAAS